MHAHADTYKSGWAGIRRGGRAWGITELVPAIPPPRLQQLSPQIQKTQWQQSRWHIELQPPDNSGAKGS